MGRNELNPLPEDVANSISPIKRVGRNGEGYFFATSNTPLAPEEYPDQKQIDRAGGIIGELKKEEGKASSTVIIGVSSGLAGLTVGGLGAYFIPKAFATDKFSEASIDSVPGGTSFGSENTIVDSRGTGSGGNSLDNSKTPTLITGDQAEQPTPAPAETQLPTPQPSPSPSAESSQDNAASAGNATPEPTPASTPIFQETPTPTASPTLRPPETPAPFDLRINADPGVSVADVLYVTDGVNSSINYMQNHFNFNLNGKLNVDIKNDTSGLFSSYRRINIGVLNQIWLNATANGKRGGAAHETGHELQSFLTNNLPTDQWGDWFLVEGVAGYINNYGLTESDYYPSNKMEACEVLRIVSNPLNVPLRQFNYETNGPTWSIAILAIKDLVGRYGDQVVPTYFSSLRAYGSENAFRLATGGVASGGIVTGGTTIEQFATQFDQTTRAQLAFPGTEYQQWANTNPCDGA